MEDDALQRPLPRPPARGGEGHQLVGLHARQAAHQGDAGTQGAHHAHLPERQLRPVIGEHAGEEREAAAGQSPQVSRRGGEGMRWAHGRGHRRGCVPVPRGTDPDSSRSRGRGCAVRCRRAAAGPARTPGIPASRGGKQATRRRRSSAPKRFGQGEAGTEPGAAPLPLQLLQQRLTPGRIEPVEALEEALERSAPPGSPTPDRRGPDGSRVCTWLEQPGPGAGPGRRSRWRSRSVRQRRRCCSRSSRSCSIDTRRSCATSSRASLQPVPRFWASSPSRSR